MKSSPDTEEIPQFTEEVEMAIQRMKRHEAQGIASDIIKLGRGDATRPYRPSKHFQQYIKTKRIPDSWHEAKIIFLFKKADPKT